MTQRRILYSVALAGALVFYWAYREWLAGFLLVLLLALPWISLLLTLPAALLGRPVLQHPQAVTLGADARISWQPEGPLPPAPPGGKLRCRVVGSRRRKRLASGDKLPTEHCGMLVLEPGVLWLRDYLELTAFPGGRVGRIRIPVRPLPVKPPKEPDLSRFFSGALAPKAGGGYSENHELRLYRPGDSLRQIHWKLSAKTGKLILREPMEIRGSQALVTLELSGTPAQRDEKLGRLLWMMTYLLDRDIPHRVCCLTGSGMMHFTVTAQPQIPETLDAILACPPLEGNPDPVYPTALWRCHIGGDGDEP